MKYDVVIPYRNSGTSELKFALRSIAKNVPHASVYIVGDRPEFETKNLKVIERPRNKDSHNQLDMELNIIRALREPNVTEDVILFNDDFYVLQPIWELHTMHQGELKAVIKQKKLNIRTRRMAKYMQNCYDLLTTLGVKDPVAYTLHVPVVINTQKYLDISEEITVPNFKNGNVVLPRTIYSNLSGVVSCIHRDVKLYDAKQPLEDYLFASTSHMALKGEAFQQVKQMFPNKCRYEA